MVVTRCEICAAGEHKKYSTDIKKLKGKKPKPHRTSLKGRSVSEESLILLPVKLIRATVRS